MNGSRQRQRVWWAWALFPSLLLLVALPGPRPRREDRSLDRSALRPGLAGHFHDARSEVRLAPSWPCFQLQPGESIHPALGPDFDAEWTGFLRVPARGRYRFRSEGRVFVDGQETQGRTVRLPAGDLALRVLYQRRGDREARLALRWASDTFPEQPVPSRSLWHWPTPELARFAAIERGRTSAASLRCFHCHETRAFQDPRRQGPDLTHIGRRTHAGFLMRWLEQPRGVVAHATMPALPLSDEECRDVATYLTGLDSFPAKQVGVPAASIIDQGRRLFDGMGCGTCHDGDRLPLDHLAGKTTVGPLTEYLLDPRAVHPDGAMPALFLQPDQDTSHEKIRARKVAWYLLREAPDSFETFEPGDPVRGEELVYSSGCLSCHTFAPSAQQRERAAGTSTRHTTPRLMAPAAPTLDQMVLFGGCLAGEPDGVSPTYRLEAEERDDLVAFLRWLRDHPDRSPAPVHALTRQVAELRCTACHEWRGQKPRQAFAKPPPSLTQVGARHSVSFLEAVLGEDRRRERDGPGLRMPHFGPAHATSLVRGLRAATETGQTTGETVTGQ